MGTTAKANSGGGAVYDDSVPAPAGNHLAICVGVIDIGTQYKRGVAGQYEDSWKYQVLLQWELCDELMDDGRPFTISRRFTLSLHEKSELRHLLESWRGRPFTLEQLEGFDVQAVLGVPCMLNVIQKPARRGDRVYANVTGATPVPVRMRSSVPRPVNPLVYYSMDDGEPPAILPEWVRNLIRQAQEYSGGQANGQSSRSQPLPQPQRTPRQPASAPATQPAPVRSAAPPPGQLADGLAQDIRGAALAPASASPPPQQHDVISIGDLGDYCRDAQQALGVNVWLAVYNWAMTQRFPIKPEDWTVDQVDAAYRVAKRRVETAIPERLAAPPSVAPAPASAPEPEVVGAGDPPF